MPGGRPTRFYNPEVAREAVRERGAELLSAYGGFRETAQFRCLNRQPDGSTCHAVFQRQWGVAFRDKVIRCRECISSRVRAVQVKERTPTDWKLQVRQKGGEVMPHTYVNAHTKIPLRCLAETKAGPCGTVFLRTRHSLRVNKTAYCLPCTNREISRKARDPGRIGYSREKVESFFEERSAKLLTQDYGNVHQMLDYICGTPGCGQTWHATMQALLLSRPNPGDTIECKECQDANRPRGTSSPHYRADLSDEDRQANTFLRGKPSAIWARLVRALYGQSCLIDPGSTPIEAHHLASWRDNPQDRFVVTNGVPLCERLHDEYHAKWAPGKRGTADLQSFHDFFHHHTGVTFSPLLPGLVPEIIQPFLNLPPSALLVRKKEWAEKGMRYIPLFPGEAENRRDVVVSMLRNRSGLTAMKVGARSLKLVKIPSMQARRFFGDNHVQGYAPASCCYGLSDGVILLSAMLFTPLRVPSGSGPKSGWELVRMANKAGWSVPGAASRLLHAFLKEHGAVPVTTYADRRFCANDPQDTVYPRLGFTYSHASRPSYRYTNREGTLLLNKKSFQRRHLADRLGERFDPSKSESANMRDAGYYRLWDCGTFVFHLSA